MRKRLLFSIAMIMCITIANAQELKDETSVETRLEQNSKAIAELQNNAQKSWTKNLKMSGALQMQWQMSQSKGGDAKFNGGNFAEDVNNRFLLRRARMKLAYKSDYLSSWVQLDASSGGVSVADATIQFHLPNQVFALTTGLVYLPFTYCIQYSSSARKIPEMVRVIKSLVPSDTGLGGHITFKGTKGTELNNLQLDLGAYSQNGTKADYDQRKTIITRLQYNKKHENISWGLMAGVLYGGVKNIENDSYSFESGKGYIKKEGVVGEYNTSIYYNLGAKLTASSAIGKTIIWSEYYWGNQPASADANTTLKATSLWGDSGAVYNRKFNGFYVDVNHEIVDTDFTLLVRLDQYTPNSEIKGDAIGKLEGTGNADIAYTTLGTGLCYSMLKDKLRVIAYYEFVWNETSANLPEFTKNIKDNLLTVRLQAKF